MYIRRKVFSSYVDEYGEERIFSSTEFISEEDYFNEQREFTSVRALKKGMGKVTQQAKNLYANAPGMTRSGVKQTFEKFSPEYRNVAKNVEKIDSMKTLPNGLKNKLGGIKNKMNIADQQLAKFKVEKTSFPKVKANFPKVQAPKFQPIR